MSNEECRMKNGDVEATLNSSFVIRHSSFRFFIDPFVIGPPPDHGGLNDECRMKNVE